MSKNKKGVLPSLEIIIILVFFLSFIIWAVSKCGATKMQYNTENSDSEASTDADDTDSIYFSMPKPLPPKEEPIIEPVTTTTRVGNETVRTEILSRLYVNMNDLNMRTGPHLDSSIVQKLKLDEEVYFTGEYTDSTQQISLPNKEIVNEPWVQVKSKKGKVGWVYGAFVDYRKKKRE